MEKKKHNRSRIRDIIIFLVILLISSYLLPQSTVADSWIVLPKEINPYKSSILKDPDPSVKLVYPQEVLGTLINSDKQEVVKILIDKQNYYLPLQFLVKKTSVPEHQKNIPIGDELVDIKTPLPINYKPDDLVKIDQKWNYHAADYSKYLRKEVATSLTQMFNEAKKQGLSLKVVSAFRAFSKQRQLYLRAIKKNGLDQNTVAKPGHSEHQLGTTIDVSSFTPESVLNKSFGDTNEGKWMKKNANKFGFYQSYTMANSKSTGYIPEPWHFRFIGLPK